MRRLLAAIVLLSAFGCKGAMGYRRPAARNLNAVGAPAVGVGTDGLVIGEPRKTDGR